MDIFSETLERYGNIELLFQLLEDNGITVTDDVSVGLEYIIDDSLRTFTNFVEPAIATTPQPFDYVVQQSQNIFDVSISKFGTLENVFDIIEGNEIEISNQLNTGTVLIIDNYQKGIESIKRLNIISANGGQLPPDDILVWESGSPIVFKSDIDYIIYK